MNRKHYVSYKNLEIWQTAHRLVVKIHRMTLHNLPVFELYEEGSQIRRSIKSVKSNIVEGYGRRCYKKEFLRFLIFAYASCDETKDHLETLFDTGSLKDEFLYNELMQQIEGLSKGLHYFIKAVDREHKVTVSRS